MESLWTHPLNSPQDKGDLGNQMGTKKNTVCPECECDRQCYEIHVDLLVVQEAKEKNYDQHHQNQGQKPKIVE